MLDDKEVELRFRYCPAGDISITAPWEEKIDQATYSTTGFFVLETELTIGQVSQILGEDSLNEARQVAADFKASIEGAEFYEQIVDSLEQQSPSVPMLFLQFQSLVELCNKLDIESTNQNLPVDSIEGRTFRLLSISEWRLAAFGDVETKGNIDRRLFYDYPQLEDINVGIIRRFEKVLAEHEANAVFNGSVDDFYRVLSGSYKPETRQLANEALRMFYASTILPKSTADDLNNPSSYPLLVNNSTANAYGLFDLLSGVPEWVFLANSEIEMASKWNTVKDSVLNDKNRQGFESPSIPMTLAGGSFARPVTDRTNSNDDWYTATIWGGPKMDNGKLREFKIQNYDSITSDKHAGVRLGMFRTVRPNWFATIRLNFTNDPESARVVEQAFAGLNKTIGEIGTLSDKENVLPVINFYNALCFQSLNTLAQASNLLVNTSFPAVKGIPVSNDKPLGRSRLDPNGSLTGLSKIKKRTKKQYIDTPASEHQMYVDLYSDLIELDIQELK